MPTPDKLPKLTRDIFDTMFPGKQQRKLLQRKQGRRQPRARG